MMCPRRTILPLRHRAPSAALRALQSSSPCLRALSLPRPEPPLRLNLPACSRLPSRLPGPARLRSYQRLAEENSLLLSATAARNRSKHIGSWPIPALATAPSMSVPRSMPETKQRSPQAPQPLPSGLDALPWLSRKDSFQIRAFVSAALPPTCHDFSYAVAPSSHSLGTTKNWIALGYTCLAHLQNESTIQMNLSRRGHWTSPRVWAA